MDEDEFEDYDREVELAHFKEYRDVVGMFKHVVETERRFYLANDVKVTRHDAGTDFYFELELTDGRRLRHHTRAVRGTPDNPMTRAEVDAKSYDLMAPVLGRSRARKLCDAVWNLDKLDDVRRLRTLLCR